MWSARYRAYGNLAALDVAEIDNPLCFQRNTSTQKRAYTTTAIATTIRGLDGS